MTLSNRNSTAIIIKFYYLIILSLFPIATASLVAAPPAGKGYDTITWGDEFDGPNVDTTKWAYRLRPAHEGALQEANVSIDNGRLRIDGKEETVQVDGESYDYTGGGVISRQTLGYGYYETRAKLTNTIGWHSSFWQMGADGFFPGAEKRIIEIDGFEVDSHEPEKVKMNTHHKFPKNRPWGARPDGVKDYIYPVGSDTSDGFHVYGWEWTPTEVTWYVDGVEVSRSNFPGPHFPQEVWLTCIALDYEGNGIFDGASVFFDYFRYYEKDFGVNDTQNAQIATATQVTASGTWEQKADEAVNHQKVRSIYRSKTNGDTATWRTALSHNARYEVFVWNASHPEDSLADYLGLFGEWRTSVIVEGYLGKSYLFGASTGSDHNIAAFEPPLPEKGAYNVYIRWTDYHNRATEAKVRIQNFGTSLAGPFDQNDTDRSIDQTEESGPWYLLTDQQPYYFDEGVGARVRFSTQNAGGSTIVDAVRFQQVEDANGNPTNVDYIYDNSLPTAMRTYTINDKTWQNKDVTFDSLSAGQGWVGLGCYEFNAAEDDRVTLTVDMGQNKGFHRYDALLFKRFTLLDEDFDDSTANDWTPTSGTWTTETVNGEDIYKQSNTSGISISSYLSTGWQNYFVRARVRLVGNSSIGGVMGRYNGNGDFYHLRINNNTSSKNFELWRYHDGSWKFLDGVSFDPAIAHEWHDIYLQMNGTQIKGFLDGVEYINVVDDAIPSGTIGLRTIGGPVEFDLVGAGHH